MLEWFGLRGERPPGDIQMWQGTKPRTKWIAAAIWIAAAVLSFFLIKNALPASEGVLGFLPIYTSIVVFVAGMSVTERSCVRAQDASKG